MMPAFGCFTTCAADKCGNLHTLKSADACADECLKAAKRCGWREVNGKMYCPVHGHYAEDNKRRNDEMKGQTAALQRAQTDVVARRRRTVFFVDNGSPAAQAIMRLTSQQPIPGGMALVSKAELKSLRADMLVVEVEG